MPIFTAVTLTAPVLVAAGAVLGGVWALAGLLWMTALTAFLDRLITATLPAVEGDEFPAADYLSLTLAVVHFALWILIVAALSGSTGLVLWEKLAVFQGAALFMGQVSNSNAHELIHRPGRWLRRAGRWIYISILFGHHLSAHTLVHHVHVGTLSDPNTARLGEGFYRFFPRALFGSFKEGLRAENKRFPRLGRPAYRHPYVAYIGGAIGFLVLAALIGGLNGVIAAFLLATFSQTQLMLSDYVQHYGLSRRIMPNGKPEPVNSRHSWNAPQPMSSALMLNAPRHSDHHANPVRPYPTLRLDENMPMLPRSLPVMATLALFPRYWRRVMDPRAKEWQSPAS
ncbi:alkane 1-monooxygenase [Octadecabacter sp. 1_MG-2023]|uniref:alkane 1-monooxygenase n=1 Tax=unclassified Octadecabacter TaxID=196158 RepID=UPI001C0815D7|nr:MULTISPECIES: alkane 1-monooxygenase [unclassified Octadecabacter]MBU2992773.1 alkane 1-monooxygenase [Octadecabacter sp. B2R22]MDO6733776.1 alkane 1-monooxygenase [Octadecabacter sp. 1_MG-2023]